MFVLGSFGHECPGSSLASPLPWRRSRALGIFDRARWWGPPIFGEVHPHTSDIAAEFLDRSRALPAWDGRRYLLLRELTVSRSAEVYVAADTLIGRLVVVKLTARALREGRALALARHPHVIELHDLAHFEGRPYLVMPYCEGGTLLERSYGQPWPLVLSRVLEVGDALAGCHAQLLVHGDVKPANILVTQGRAVLADFGLARRPDLVEEISGTPGYIAPELSEGRRSPSNDVFSLACTTWMCLLGALPHSGSSCSGLLLAAEAHRVDWPVGGLSRRERRVLRAVSRGLHPRQSERPGLREWLSGVAGAIR